jgi:hypothetical protein
MDEFIIKGGPDYLKISFQEVFGFPESTCFSGGYDTRSIIEIKSSDFLVKSTIHVSTGELYKFYEDLVKCNQMLKGIIGFGNYEYNLNFKMQYDIDGHVSVRGNFETQNGLDNSLKFHFISDQSYMQSTLKQLQAIKERYGDMNGVKK